MNTKSKGPNDRSGTQRTPSCGTIPSRNETNRMWRHRHAVSDSNPAPSAPIASSSPARTPHYHALDAEDQFRERRPGNITVIQPENTPGRRL